MKTQLAIYGIGNFGYAWLKHFDAMESETIQLIAFDRDPSVIQSLQTKRTHPFLHTTISISDRVQFAASPEELVKDADIILLAVTSDATREVLQNIKPYLKDTIILINTAKALDNKSGKRLSEIVAQECGEMKYSYALLAGGTIASDLFAQEPLGIDLACENTAVHKTIVEVFGSPSLRVYPTTDLSGVEYASAFKNIIAILAGMINGMGFSYGSETHLISRAAFEIEQLVTTQLGGKPETFSMKSQCWGNDLWMSCTGPTRNRAFGELLGKGTSVDKAIEEMEKQHKTVEGIRTIAVLNTIPGIADYPLIDFLYQYIEKRSGSLEDLRNIIFEQSF